MAEATSADHCELPQPVTLLYFKAFYIWERLRLGFVEQEERQKLQNTNQNQNYALNFTTKVNTNNV